MFQRKEREVVTGPEAKSVRLENNLWLLTGRVWLPELWEPQRVSLADSGGRAAHARCVCVCAPEPARKPTATPWGPPCDCCGESGGGDATKLASRFYGGLAATPLPPHANGAVTVLKVCVLLRSSKSSTLYWPKQSCPIQAKGSA